MAATAAALAVIGGCTQLAQKERELVFGIVPGVAGWYDGTPDGLVEIQIPHDEKKSGELHAWWWPSTNPDAPALLYLHGARWNLTGQLFRIEQLHRLGFSVLAVDYRGFGKSLGELPSEQTVYQDARSAWQHLAQLQPDPARRLIYGHSLGGAIAIDLAASLAQVGRPAAQGLIVESTFTSLADIARAFTYSWLPMQLLLSQKFDSLQKIATVNMPVLIAHGTADMTVPLRFSQELFKAAPGRKQLLMIEGGTHNNSMRLGEMQYRKALAELFKLAPAAEPRSAM